MAHYAPEFLAAVRHRYEKTDQPMIEMAREFGIGITTLQVMVDKQGWEKRSQRLRGLPRALRLQREAEALAAGVVPPEEKEPPPPTPPRRSFRSRVEGSRRPVRVDWSPRRSNGSKRSSYRRSPIWNPRASCAPASARAVPGPSAPRRRSPA